MGKSQNQTMTIKSFFTRTSNISNTNIRSVNGDNGMKAEMVVYAGAGIVHLCFMKNKIPVKTIDMRRKNGNIEGSVHDYRNSKEDSYVARTHLTSFLPEDEMHLMMQLMRSKMS